MAASARSASPAVGYRVPTEDAQKVVNALVLSKLSYQDPHDSVALDMMRQSLAVQHPECSITMLEVGRFGADGSQITFVFAEDTQKTRYMCFKGSSVAADWLRNAAINNLTSSFGVTGALHSGFGQAALDAPMLWATTHLLSSTQGDVVLCGHSLGGAIATLCGIHFLCHETDRAVKRRLSVWTFGAPLVCDAQVGSELRDHEDQFRHFVIESDIVPKLLYKPFLNKLKDELAASKAAKLNIALGVWNGLVASSASASIRIVGVLLPEIRDFCFRELVPNFSPFGKFIVIKQRGVFPCSSRGMGEHLEVVPKSVAQGYRSHMIEAYLCQINMHAMPVTEVSVRTLDGTVRGGLSMPSMQDVAIRGEGRSFSVRLYGNDVDMLSLASTCLTLRRDGGQSVPQIVSAERIQRNGRQFDVLATLKEPLDPAALAAGHYSVKVEPRCMLVGRSCNPVTALLGRDVLLPAERVRMGGISATIYEFVQYLVRGCSLGIIRDGDQARMLTQLQSTIRAIDTWMMTTSRSFGGFADSCRALRAVWTRLKELSGRSVPGCEDLKTRCLGLFLEHMDSMPLFPRHLAEVVNTSTLSQHFPPEIDEMLEQWSVAATPAPTLASIVRTDKLSDLQKSYENSLRHDLSLVCFFVAVLSAWHVHHSRNEDFVSPSPLRQRSWGASVAVLAAFAAVVPFVFAVGAFSGVAAVTIANSLGVTITGSGVGAAAWISMLTGWAAGSVGGVEALKRFSKWLGESFTARHVGAVEQAEIFYYVMMLTGLHDAAEVQLPVDPSPCSMEARCIHLDISGKPRVHNTETCIRTISDHLIKPVHELRELALKSLPFVVSVVGVPKAGKSQFLKSCLGLKEDIRGNRLEFGPGYRTADIRAYEATVDVDPRRAVRALFRDFPGIGDATGMSPLSTVEGQLPELDLSTALVVVMNMNSDRSGQIDQLLSLVEQSRLPALVLVSHADELFMSLQSSIESKRRKVSETEQALESPDAARDRMIKEEQQRFHDSLPDLMQFFQKIRERPELRRATVRMCCFDDLVEYKKQADVQFIRQHNAALCGGVNMFLCRGEIRGFLAEWMLDVKAKAQI